MNNLETSDKLIATKSATKNVVKVAIVIWCVGLLAVLAIASVSSVSPKKSVKNQITFSKVDGFPVDFNTAQTINVGDKDIMLLAIKVKATQATVISDITIRTSNLVLSYKNGTTDQINFFKSKTAGFSNLRLFKVNYLSDQEKFDSQVVGTNGVWKLDKVTGGNSSTGPKATGLVVFKGMKLDVPANKTAILFLQGDFIGVSNQKNSSGSISFGLTQASDIKAKAIIKSVSSQISVNVSGPVITMNATRPVPQISISSPTAKEFKIGNLISINWVIKNVDTNMPVGVFLMHRSVVEGVNIDELKNIIAFNYGGTNQLTYEISNTGVDLGDNYFIKVNCGLGIDLPSGCQAGESNLFTIK